VSAFDTDVGSGTPAEERRLLASLRARDEEAFVELVERHTPAMLRVARLYVRTEAVAEEVVQETWIAVLGGIDGFAGRSTLRTWIFAMLANVARHRGAREARSMPLAGADLAAEGAFFPPGHRWAGMWSTVVGDWSSVPHEQLLGAEARGRLREALEALPARYAVVFVLRDVEGWSGEEVCSLLGVSAANQRVLLHRARLRIRAALEKYFERADP
jgi:RNA polymerase sigma-70 factor (ECF subfamily)